MPRQSVEELRLPPPGYRVDQVTDHPSGIIQFETVNECLREDILREGAVERFANTTDDKPVRQRARRLGHLYSKVLRRHQQPLSAASRMQMRDWRIRISGWLWMLLAGLSLRHWVFFTIAVPSWWVHSDELDEVTAKQLMQRLRAALYRTGAGRASGWLYAMLDGEFDGTTKGFPFHVHGIATKGMIGVLRRLREQRQFKRNSTDAHRFPEVPVFRKMRIDRPYGDLPSVITYASKSIWLQHNSQLGPDGKRRRVGMKYRISGVHRIRHLLWLHANPVKDHVLIVHLSVIDGKLVPTKRGSR